MRLYKATYVWTEQNVRTREVPLYITASDFMSAIKLAETNERICPVIGAAGDVASLLSRVELVAFNVVQE